MMSVLRCHCEDVAAEGVGCLAAPALSAVCVLTLDTEPLIPPASDQKKREGDGERARGSK